MLELTRNQKVDFDSYYDDLTYLGYIYINREKLNSYLDYLPVKVSTERYLVEDVMTTKSGCKYTDCTREGVIAYLKEIENCPDRYFRNNKTQGESLSKKTTLEPLLDKGLAEEFITKYMSYNTTKHNNGFLKGLREESVKVDKPLSNDDEPLSKLFFNYNKIANKRVSTSKPNVQGIPKNYNDIITAPSGYTIVSGDFAQADMRIAYSMFLRDENNIEIMEKCQHDIYEGYFKILLGDDFDLDDFKKNRQEYKKYALAPIYGDTRAETRKGWEIITKANKYLSMFPNYVEYKRRLNLKESAGFPIVVKSYQGSVALAENNMFDRSKSAVNFALNSPIQTGTSEILISVERAIVKEFEKLGVTKENGGLYVYMNRHDELLFLIKNEYLKYSYIFQDNSVVQVDDWFPLKIDWSYHKDYCIDEPSLDEYAKSFYKDVPPIKIKKTGFSFYCPTSDILELSIGVAPILGTNDSVVSYLDTRKLKVGYFKISDFTAQKALDSVLSKILEARDTLINKDLQSIIVYSQLSIPNTISANGLMIKLENSYNGNLLELSNGISQIVSNKIVPNSLPRTSIYNQAIEALRRGGTILDE